MNSIGRTKRNLCISKDGLLHDMIRPRAHKLHILQLGRVPDIRQRSAREQDGHVFPVGLGLLGVGIAIVKGLLVDEDVEVGELGAEGVDGVLRGRPGGEEEELVAFEGGVVLC